MTDDDAKQLLRALQMAGSYCYVDYEGDFLCTPSARRVDWDGDVEEDVAFLHDELRDLILREQPPVH